MPEQAGDSVCARAHFHLAPTGWTCPTFSCLRLSARYLAGSYQCSLFTAEEFVAIIGALIRARFPASARHRLWTMRKTLPLIICVALALIGVAGLIALLKTPPEIRSALSDLQSREANVRWQAADRLASMGPRAKVAVPDLVAALNDPEPNGLVTISVLKALVAVGAEPSVAIPALVETVKNGKGQAPVWAIRSLFDFGPEGRKAFMELIRQDKSTEDVTHALASFGQAG